MKVFLYQAALYCQWCGEGIRRERHEYAPLDPNDESSYDSDVYPKGPYDKGGGEADTPQHCDSCGLFLENPLTTDGGDYVRAAAEPYTYPDERDGDVAPWSLVAERAAADGKQALAEWIEFYLADGM